MSLVMTSNGLTGGNDNKKEREVEEAWGDHEHGATYLWELEHRIECLYPEYAWAYYEADNNF